MPTYDYACRACGHRFERVQSIAASPVRTCPGCGRRRVKRVIGPGGGLLFKGSGFYITDYRSQGYRDKAKSESEAEKPKPKEKADKPKETAPDKPKDKADKPKPAEPKKP